MFDYVGAKLQTLAKVVCWIGIIASALVGLLVIIAGFASHAGFGGLISGLIMAAVGALLAWLGSLSLYAFGQLVEDVHTMSSRRDL